MKQLFWHALAVAMATLLVGALGAGGAAAASSPAPGLVAAGTSQANCDIAYLKSDPAFYPLLKASAFTLQKYGLKKLYQGRASTDNMFACGTGKVTVRVQLPRAHKSDVLLAKGLKVLHYASAGRVHVKLKPTQQGLIRLKAALTLRLRVVTQVYDQYGASVKDSRLVTVKRYPTATQTRAARWHS